MTDHKTTPRADGAEGDDVAGATGDANVDVEAAEDAATATERDASGESATDDSTADAVDAEAADEPVGDAVIDEEPADEEIVDDAADLDEAAGHDEPVDEEPVGEEPVGEEPVDEPVADVAADEKPADEEPADETDLVEAADAEGEASVDGSVTDEDAQTGETALAPTVALAVADANTPSPAAVEEPVYAWAPADANAKPKKRKKRAAIWLSSAAAVAVIALVVSSLVLIAPGTAVAGVPVGWMTPGAAAEAIDDQLAATTVVLTGEGEDAEITGAELGATVDSRALADAAFAEHPMWNPTAWFADNGAEVEIDAAAATAALREAAPQLYTEPTDAEVTFDAATAAFVTTAAVPGTGVDISTLQEALQSAFETGETRVEVDPTPAEVPADVSTETADATVAQLNGMLDVAGFYVGDERTVPVDRTVAASWLTVTPEDDGFAITADAAAIQPVVDTLAGVVNRSPENALQITDTSGKVLKEVAAGQSGRELGDTSTFAADYAAQLSTGDAAFKLTLDEVPVTTVTLARNIVVDISEQRAYFYENGVVVNTTRVSSGMDGHETDTGNFRIRTKLVAQNMGNPDTTQWPYYYTKDVPWVMYFNGDQALHGAYWHNDFGRRRSHGCVNFPMGIAKWAYDWAPTGTEVRVQS